MEVDIDINEAWPLILKAFPILGNNKFSLDALGPLEDDEISKSFSHIKTLKLQKYVHGSVISRIESYTRSTVVPAFWKHFTEAADPEHGFTSFYNSVNTLHENYKLLSVLTNRIDLYRGLYGIEEKIYQEATACEALKLIIRATVLSQLPDDYKSTIEAFYEVALHFEDKLLEECKCCKNVQADCVCSNLFNETNSKLVELQMLEPFVEQVLTHLICKYIENHIEKTCKDSFDVSHIESLEKWLEGMVVSWLMKIYNSKESSTAQNSVTKFNKKLTAFLYNTYTTIRINQLFNIIIEYPESLPALEDLRQCLSKTDLIVSKKLQKALETRLLHPGVSTPDILTAYVAAIRSMRVLDPSGLLLDTVTKPVHQYLRSREDTVRCVVSSLTEEGPNDLAEELVKGEVLQTDENNMADEDAENWESWMPDPIDADPNKSLSYRRTSDIISMLVNVYGSKELFVNEYRTLLADRLLSQFSCDTEKEIRNLELLKLRFGDSQLHYCEVMLKDIADSKRINQHIKQDPEYTEERIPMSAMIVSAQFWPAFKEEKLEMHVSMELQMEEYTRAFETLKGNRTLSWKNHLGIVDLEIELPNRTLNLSVSPVHATIILYFSEKNQWNLDELSRIMNVPATLLRRKIGFWQSHGLIEEISPDLFHFMEECDESVSTQHDDIVVEDYEAESAMASAQDQREEELQTFWSYIIGMLMNLDSLPLDRIHQMLKMFAFQGPTIECTIQELKKFLDRKVREHELVFTGGLYRLPKS